jgi:hypothetical protein
MDSNELKSELQSLRAFYADLDVSLVDAAWEQSGHDYKVAMEELAEVVKSPTAAAKLMRRDTVSRLNWTYNKKLKLIITLLRVAVGSSNVQAPNIEFRYVF